MFYIFQIAPLVIVYKLLLDKKVYEGLHNHRQLKLGIQDQACVGYSVPILKYQNGQVLGRLIYFLYTHLGIFLLLK